nr:hypothetical protein [Tanacetum cinerariifolium]
MDEYNNVKLVVSIAHSSKKTDVSNSMNVVSISNDCDYVNCGVLDDILTRKNTEREEIESLGNLSIKLFRVNRCIDASGSNPKSNTKKNRISPAKGVKKMQVEEQPRTNKSHLRTTNRVDSSSRPKHTVINSNSDSVCQTCNKMTQAHQLSERALEKSLKSIYDAPRGSLQPVVIRKPEFGKYQPLLEVQGKGKEKVTNEQGLMREFQMKAMLDQTLVIKMKSRLDQTLHEQDEGQAGPNLGDAATSQPIPSLVVHAGPNLKHMDLEAIDVSTQPHPELMDEGFTATAYPKVQENRKLTIEEQVILEEPASSTGTLSSLQHLDKDLSFGDLFFNDKPSEADNEKTTAETKVESMVSVTIQQDTSSIPPMTTPITDLTSRPDSPNVHWPLQAMATKTTTTTKTTIHPPPPQPQQSTTYSMLMKRIDELEHIMANLIQDNKHLEERLDSHGAHHMMLYDALKKSMNCDHSEELLKDLAKARKKKKKRRDLPKMPFGSPPHQPPPPPPPAGLFGTLGSPGASGSSQVLPSPPLPLSTNQEDLQMDDNMAPDAQVHSSEDEDIRNANIPKVNVWQDWWKPLEEDRPAIPEPAWSIPSSNVPVPKNNQAFALASTYSPPSEDSLLVQTGERQCLWTGSVKDKESLNSNLKTCKALHLNLLKSFILMHNVSKPLSLCGPPSQVTIKFDFFFNKDLEYLRYSSKGSRPALSISKIKAAYYPDVGLEQMVPDQIAIRTHMRILSVFRIEVFSMYGDFEDLYLLNLQGHLNHLPPKDKKILTTAVNLWTRHLVIRQRVEDFQFGIKSYQTQLNLTKPRWDATGFKYKHDYTVIDSPRAITFHDKYGVQMILRFNEIHKFSDGTLHQIDEALDYRVKEFKVAVYSSLQSLKPKRTIESRAKRSSKIILLGHYSIMLASSHTMKSKTDIKSPTHYPRGIARTSE